MKLKLQYHPNDRIFGLTITKKHIEIALIIITLHILFDGEDQTETQRRIKK